MASFKSKFSFSFFSWIVTSFKSTFVSYPLVLAHSVLSCNRGKALLLFFTTFAKLHERAVNPRTLFPRHAGVWCVLIEDPPQSSPSICFVASQSWFFFSFWKERSFFMEHFFLFPISPSDAMGPGLNEGCVWQEWPVTGQCLLYKEGFWGWQAAWKNWENAALNTCSNTVFVSWHCWFTSLFALNEFPFLKVLWSLGVADSEKAS